MSDTPRTDDQECDMFVGVSTFTSSDIQQAFDFARTLERELNAANQRIKRLEREVELLRLYGNKDCTAQADEVLKKEDKP